MDKFELVDSALRGACTVYRLIFPQGTAIDDTARLHEIILKDVPELLKNKRAEMNSFKWYLGLKVVFAKAINPDVITVPPVVFFDKSCCIASFLGMARRRETDRRAATT